MVENGLVKSEIKLPPAALRRLARLHARTEGAQTAAQAAAQALQVLQTQLREALTEACEEEGLSVGSMQASVDIDWRTGVVTFGPETTPPLPPAPVEPAAEATF